MYVCGAMVVAKGGNGRWLRKYKVFFLIGLIILVFQIFLCTRFLELNRSTTQDNWQPQADKKVITTNKRTANTSVLRLDELNFKPECEITGKEAISAIHRAKTQRCKQILANITCLSLAGKLYPHSLIGSCPNDGKVYGKPLGCFKDENNYRILNGYFGVNKKLNSPKYCIQLCLQSGFPYAGVQYASECFCGNDEPPTKSKLPDSSCNMKCPGDGHETCGGYYTINIYETGIRKFVPQIANDEASSTEKPVKIVFLLTLNGRALRQVKRLIKLLYHENHYYYIHVDVREDYLFRELLSLERFPNIRLTRHRFATIWGGASLLEMLLNCMSELLEMSNWEWDFVLNLSESDYPVKTIGSLERFLTANKNRNFVKSHGRDTQRFLQKQGLDKTFVECEMRMWRVADRQLPSHIQIDGGSDWIALSRLFVKYVTQEHDNLINGLLEVFKYTLLPAESFFHTVLRNSKFCDSYVDNNLHVTNWKRKLGCKCQYKHVVDWCGCSPNDFRPDDWSRIQATFPRQLYFARKFEPIINQAVIYKLELWLFGYEKAPKKVPNIHSYWQSIYHYLDLTPSIDDGLKTITAAVTRVWCNSLNNSSNIITPIKQIEVISYHFQDSYKYTLVQFKAETGSLLIDLQLAFKPMNKMLLITPSTLTKRLENFSVNSDYDQKEQLSRNFAKILTPYSDPVAIYEFSSSNNEPAIINMTCLWIDPTGVLIDITEISIDENQSLGYSKPILKQPHLPGSWTVKLLFKQTLLAEVKFLITPLEFFNGKPLTPKQAHLINTGSIYPRIIGDNYDKFLNNKFEESVLKRTSVLNSKKVGKDLNDWIDMLFVQFYTIEQVCVVGNAINLSSGINLDTCKKTMWSSYSPDPKSAIGEINQTTGTFNIW